MWLGFYLVYMIAFIAYPIRTIVLVNLPPASSVIIVSEQVGSCDRFTFCSGFIFTGFPSLRETLVKSGINFGSLNHGNSLEFCVKTLNPLEICERQKIDQHRKKKCSLNFILFCHQPLFRKIIDTSLECSIYRPKTNLEINGRSC